MKQQFYVAPCVAKKPQKSTAVTMTLIIGGIIVSLGGIGDGTADLNLLVVFAGLCMAALGGVRISSH